MLKGGGYWILWNKGNSYGYLIEHCVNEWHSGNCWALWDCYIHLGTQLFGIMAIEWA
jgi:hypothetical protein